MKNPALKTLTCAIPLALLLVAPKVGAEQALSIDSTSEEELQWRDMPKPVLQRHEREHTPVAIKELSGIEPIWHIDSADGTLSNTVSRWCRHENWQLIWEADRDFPILASVYLKGSFESALDKVMRSLSETDYPLQAILNPSTKVVRIVRYLQAPNF